MWATENAEGELTRRSMTGANMYLVTVDIRLPDDAPAPVPKLEPGEHIVHRLVRLRELSGALRGE